MPFEQLFPWQFRTRWVELQRAGYIQFVGPGNWVLTERGLSVLMAEADNPLHKSQLKKPSLVEERAGASRQITKL